MRQRARVLPSAKSTRLPARLAAPQKAMSSTTSFLTASKPPMARWSTCACHRSFLPLETPSLLHLLLYLHCGVRLLMRLVTSDSPTRDLPSRVDLPSYRASTDPLVTRPDRQPDRRHSPTASLHTRPLHTVTQRYGGSRGATS